MLAEIRSYVKRLDVGAENVDIIVRAYANVKGLAKGYAKQWNTDGSCDLRAFVHGFNRRQVLFDFVDVGPGYEKADNKIRGEEDNP